MNRELFKNPKVEIKFLIDENRIKLISKWIKKYKTEELILRNCYIKSSHIISFFKELKTNKFLKKLDLSSNIIGYKCEKYIAKMLKENSTLEELNLSHNCLRGDQIFLSLTHNKTLKKLNLTDNGIYNHSEIITMIKENRDLESLILYHNRVFYQMKKRILDALQTNSTLIELKLSTRSIDDIPILSKISHITQKRNAYIIPQTIKSISYMILTSTQMKLGGKFVPKDIRRLIAKYVLYTRKNWLI